MGITSDIIDQVSDEIIPGHDLVTGLGHPILDKIAGEFYGRSLDAIGGPMASWLLSRAPTWTYNPPVVEKDPGQPTGFEYEKHDFGAGGWSGFIQKGNNLYGTQTHQVLRWNVDPTYNAGEVYVSTDVYYSAGQGGGERHEWVKFIRVPQLCGSEIHYNMYVESYDTYNGLSKGWSPEHTWFFPVFIDQDGPHFRNGAFVPGNVSASPYEWLPTNTLLDASLCGPMLVFLPDTPMFEVSALAVDQLGVLWYTFLTRCYDDPSLAYRYLSMVPKVTVVIGYAKQVPPFHPVFGHVKPPLWATPYA